MLAKKSSDELKGEVTAMKRVAEKLAKTLGPDYTVNYSFTKYDIYIHDDINNKDYTLNEYIKYLQRSNDKLKKYDPDEEKIKKDKILGDIIW